MTRAIDVLRYMKSQCSLTGEVRAHKLLYLTQAWTLAWEGRPLFDDRVEAWQMGPVIPSVRHRVNVTGDADAIHAEDRALVGAVLAEYVGRTGADLIQLTHGQTPWIDAWGDRRPGDSGNEEIVHEAMRKFFTREAILGRGPTRPQAATHIASAQVAQQVSHQNAQRWRRTLARLAQ